MAEKKAQRLEAILDYLLQSENAAIASAVDKAARLHGVEITVVEESVYESDDESSASQASGRLPELGAHDRRHTRSNGSTDINYATKHENKNNSVGSEKSKTPSLDGGTRSALGWGFFSSNSDSKRFASE